MFVYLYNLINHIHPLWEAVSVINNVFTQHARRSLFEKDRLKNRTILSKTNHAQRDVLYHYTLLALFTRSCDKRVIDLLIFWFSCKLRKTFFFSSCAQVLVCSNSMKTSYTCRKFLHFGKCRKIFTKVVPHYPLFDYPPSLYKNFSYLQENRFWPNSTCSWENPVMDLCSKNIPNCEIHVRTWYATSNKHVSHAI